MKSVEIQQRIKDLKEIMANYKHELGSLEKDLYLAISEYQRELEKEKLKEIRGNLS
jgi:hypothetical protein